VAEGRVPFWQSLVAALVRLFQRLLGLLGIRRGPLTVNLKAHVPGEGELYCEYPITQASPGAPLAVGVTVCIWCRNPGAVPKCDAIWQVNLAGGVWYRLGGAVNPICSNCTTRNTYEIVP
jgi:hypothetical protein